MAAIWFSSASCSTRSTLERARAPRAVLIQGTLCVRARMHVCVCVCMCVCVCVCILGVGTRAEDIFMCLCMCVSVSVSVCMRVCVFILAQSTVYIYCIHSV